jgi:hypothetical protein
MRVALPRDQSAQLEHLNRDAIKERRILFLEQEICQMKALSRITLYGAFLMALSGSAFGQKTQTDFDHQADFSQYKTYSWHTIKAHDSLWDARIKNAVDAQLAAKGWTQVDKGAVNTQPAAKGSTQVDNGPKFPFPPPPSASNGGTQVDNGPKFPFPPPPSSAAAQPEPTSSCPTSTPCVIVVAIQTTETQRSLNGFYSGFGGGLGWGGFRDGSINISEQDYQEGTLIVDMYDAKTKQLLWRGSAEGTLSDKAAKNENKLNKAVAKMFKDFPPGSTKH